MTSFLDAATSLLTTPERRVAFDAFVAAGLPTTQDEVWRYAPLDEFDLDEYSPVSSSDGLTASDFAYQVAGAASGVIKLSDGQLIGTDNLPSGVTVEVASDVLALDGSTLVSRYDADSFALLNAALAPQSVIVRVAPGAIIDGVLVIVHVASSAASFPRVYVELGVDARASIVELFEGGAHGLVVPLSEYLVGDRAALQLATYQRLAPTAWHVARSTARVGRDATMAQSFVGLGARYDRSRNDAVLAGVGATNSLRTTYLGGEQQVHDFRTRQFHVAPRTSSTLLAKGALADESRSVYTGLIEIEKGAKKTDARQTNHNLLLSRHAHADSVPNLDIRENDVACAHASSVGPLDELQRWYLESRGVSRPDAERLMIQGFFYEMTNELPSEIAELVNADVVSVLARVAVEAS